jgi:hypothetical protein
MAGAENAAAAVRPRLGEGPHRRRAGLGSPSSDRQRAEVQQARPGELDDVLWQFLEGERRGPIGEALGQGCRGSQAIQLGNGFVALNATLFHMSTLGL